MSYKHNLQTVLALLLILTASSVSARKFPHGLTIEAGGGYSQLIWKIDGPDYERKNFIFTPNIRFGYDFNLWNKISVYPFTGYNRFGGKSDVESNGYYDFFWFNIWETGLFGLYKYRNFQFGPGFKHNRHLKVYAEYYGYLSQPADSERVWETVNWSNEFAEYSYDLGLRVGWKYKHCTLAFDSWFGITNLGENRIFDDLGVDIRQNHYRLLAGLGW